MRELFDSLYAFWKLNNALKSVLSEDILESIKKRDQAPASVKEKDKLADDVQANPEKDKLADNVKTISEKRAVKVIQRAWRKSEINRAFREDFYTHYLSMIDDERAAALSKIMFGFRVAALPPDSPYRINNPFCSNSINYYYRASDLPDPLLRALLTEFNIDPSERPSCDYLPIAKLEDDFSKKIIGELQEQHGPLTLLEDEHHSMMLLLIPRDEVSSKVGAKDKLRAYGLILPLWGLAGNLAIKNVCDVCATETVHSGSVSGLKPKVRALISALNLPTSNEALFKSKTFGKLCFIASSPRHSTNKLAACVKKLLLNAPELDSQSVQRIALMMELANTFYEFHYSNYASTLVYVLAHELGLAFSNNSSGLERYFFEFIRESERTFLRSFHLAEQELSEATTVCSLALSGAHAFAKAMCLARKMHTDGVRPRVKVYQPNYYEFDYIVRTDADSDAHADIFVLSAGPTVVRGPLRLVPGLDINRVIHKVCIEAERAKPATFVVDVTTALRKNLGLTPEILRLVIQGRISIFSHDSYQKFCLAHTDQAQGGSVFGILSKRSYSSEVIEAFQSQARAEYDRFVDMQIAGYMGGQCGEILEAIKQHHFTNGALLRNLLTKCELAQTEPVTVDYMLTDPNELCFFLTLTALNYNFEKYPIERRSGFGHFTTTVAGIPDVGDGPDKTRISPGASSLIDCLIQASQLYLWEYYCSAELLIWLADCERESDPLSVDEQIMSLAVIGNIALCSFTDFSVGHLTKLSVSLKTQLSQCKSLSDSQHYYNARRYTLELESWLTKLNKLSHALTGEASDRSLNALSIIQLRPVNESDQPLVGGINAEALDAFNIIKLRPRCSMDPSDQAPVHGMGFFSAADSDGESDSEDDLENGSENDLESDPENDLENDTENDSVPEAPTVSNFYFKA